MQTLVIIIAFWLILLGIYGALPMIMQPLRRRGPIRLGAPDVRIDPDSYASDRYDPEPYASPAPARRLETMRRNEPQRALDAGDFEPAPPVKPVKHTKERPVQPVFNAAPTPASESVFNEVEMLRAQVDSLRSEIASLSSRDVAQDSADIEDEDEDEMEETPAREARFARTTRVRRYRTGAPPELPRHLRKQVKEVRSHKPAHAS